METKSLKKLSKMMACAAIALTSLLVSPVSVLAQDHVSITIAGNEGQPLSGKRFMLYKLFHVVTSPDQASVHYEWNEPYKNALQNVAGAALKKEEKTVSEYEVIDYLNTLDEAQMRYFVEDLRDEIVRSGQSGVIHEVDHTDENNQYVIEGLEHGYYLLDEQSAHGTHGAASLCMSGTANENMVVYIKSDHPQLIKKIEEDDQDVGWNDIADFEIGQTIPFKYETFVPAMDGYDTYKMVFEDRMDPRIAWDPDSLSIQIKGEKTAITLAKEEYEIRHDVNGNTFELEIEDLKAVVEAQFGSERDQKMTIRYDGWLTEDACQDTGRPGFENSVRLQYSNNPDTDGKGDMGQTPWDTVVCFTYKIDGSKVNEDAAKLQDARFRLYRDERCTDEVKMKKAENGYTVSKDGSEEIVSDDKGRFVISGLDQGTYFLKETKAPQGYRSLLDPIRIELIPTFTQERDSYAAGEGATERILQQLAAKASFREGWNQTAALGTDAANGSVQLEVVNKKGMLLPRTGSNSAILLVGIGSAATLYALKKKKDEK